MEPIKDDAELQIARRRIDELFFAAPDTPEYTELMQLVDRVIAYEDTH